VTPADATPEPGLILWHRLFGLLLKDYFAGSPFEVDVDRDLSWQKQCLDVVIIRKGEGRFRGRLPDGLESLATHNLLTFKSHRQPLDGWAMSELVGHYVSYRKLVSPSVDELLPEDQFRLYAVCARYPQGLAGQVPWQEVRPGVYDCHWGTQRIQVVVARQLPREEQNAPLHLFAADADVVDYGQGHYQARSERTSSLLSLLFKKYEGEGVTMSYTFEDLMRDAAIEEFRKMSPEQRREALRGLPPDQRRELLRGLPVEQLQDALRGLSRDQRRGLLRGLPAEELREALTPEQIAALVPPKQATSPAKQGKRGTGKRKPRRS
jgi:hypothetical protein